jgi:hypothetical protein
LQAVFAAMSLAFLLVSLLRREATGVALSAAAIGPSITLFLVYLGILCLPRFGYIGWYRVGVIPAIILFGGGGVIGNVLRFIDSGLENYASVGWFVLAVAINSYGSVLNVIAAVGLFRKEPIS